VADEADELRAALSAHLAESACRSLIARYCHTIDLGDAADVADLFVLDGVWESAHRKWVGQDAIRKAFARRQLMRRRSRHVCSTTDVTLVGPDEARAITYFVLYRYDGPVVNGIAPMTGQQVVGEYYDRLVRVEAGWRFAHRRAGNAFVRPATDLMPAHFFGDP
jgi:uncharacterized protein (TIGR02246 family)